MVLKEDVSAFKRKLFHWIKTKKHLNHQMLFCLVAEARFELTTFGLWAQRATTAPLRDIVSAKVAHSFELTKRLSVFIC